MIGFNVNTAIGGWNILIQPSALGAQSTYRKETLHAALTIIGVVYRSLRGFYELLFVDDRFCKQRFCVRLLQHFSHSNPCPDFRCRSRHCHRFSAGWYAKRTHLHYKQTPQWSYGEATAWQTMSAKCCVYVYSIIDSDNSRSLFRRETKQTTEFL